MTIPLLAGAQTDSLATRLDAVIISRSHISDSLFNAPAAIAVLSAKELATGNLADIATAFNKVPGVLMQSGALNTNRISIRGIGARTPFGTNKIRAFLGAIPLTSGDSETTIEDLDLENLSQAEIIKGPLSSVYGAGLGGAILLAPKISSRQGVHAQANSVFGSFGLIKTSADASFGSTYENLNIHYHKLESGGWRQNSGYHREGISVTGELFGRKKTKLTYIAAHTYLKAFIPSSIGKTAFDNNPRSAAATWLAAKGYEQYHSYLAGVGYEFSLGKIENSTSVFLNLKNSYEPRPFDILEQETFGYGVRTQFSGNFSDFSFIAGAEYFGDKFGGRTFENRYQQNNGNGSLEGQRLTETNQRREFYNAFAQMRWQFYKGFEFQSGINVNKTRFVLDRVFPAQSYESYNYQAILSPHLSILYKPSAWQTVYLSASRGFSLPSVEETLTASGIVNTAIKPETGTNFELGAKAYLLKNRLYVGVAIYRMTIKDLLVAKRVGDDQYVGVNAGKTLHQGIEAEARYDSDSSKNIRFSGYASVSAGNYRFENFNDGGNDYSGNALTGVPAKTGAIGGTISTGLGWYFSADCRFVDEIPLDDGNSAFSNAYNVTDVKTGWRTELRGDLSCHFAFGVNNIFDRKYASMVLVNAASVNGAEPRYYYPGLPLNVYANVGFSFTF